jgi:hypothetical protein
MPYETIPRRALGCRLVIDVADAALGEYLEVLLAALPVCTNAETVITISVHDGRYGLAVDGTSLLADATRGEVVTRLLQQLNALATASPGFVCAHASGVARNGMGFVFPAHMESGKTTLAAGLVRAGFNYLTDEAVAFDPATGVIEPYPKPLSLDPGSWPLFPELDPGSAALDLGPLEQWQVPVAAIRPDAVAAPCRARHVIFPAYRVGADTVLEPMTRGEGLVELARNTFAFNERGREALAALALVVRAAECSRLTIGTLADAVACITDLADRSTPVIGSPSDE